ncbi:hypothetical protein [Dokdonella sp.]|uniref:hypothetical protein n=1 Tax=Dokdonella sp. TaxID=2291710 RepID=UPI0025C650CE|nr:hypothetical protein [Dokdonella sp.]MBX3688416.1 hypothetical protein [Dokdonella sp.]
MGKDRLTSATTRLRTAGTATGNCRQESAGKVARRLGLAALLLASSLLVDPSAGRAAELDLGDLSAPTFVTFTSRDGVSESVASAVQTDKDGFVWLSTAHGLARYDGHSWSSAGPQAIKGTLGAFLVDHQGTLWVAFRDRGIGRWDGTSWHRQGRGTGLPTNQVSSLAETFDADGHPSLWLASGDAGLLERDAQGR